MEEQSSSGDGEKQSALKNLLFCDSEKCRTEHNGAKLDESEINANQNTEQPKASGTSPSRRSPDPNCVICLGTLENKSFTDSCFHTFCFTCLVKWSKVKAECPLCKQPFKSIVHNVRSNEDYDQFFISSKSADTSRREADGRSFHYRSTLTSERWTAGRHHYGTFEDSIEYRMHRMIYAPHSVSFPPLRNVVSQYPSTSTFRRHIYESGLWVKPSAVWNSHKYRITFPECYRQNPSCTHRLIPWLNRELLALLYDSESQVTFVLELILALIMRYDIRSEEFYVHIEPYLQQRTSHFIHEFFNYASSFHDMHNYDSCAFYEKLESVSGNSANVASSSSPDSDVVQITTPPMTVSENVPSLSQIQTLDGSSLNLSKRRKKSSKRQPKIFLRKNEESNVRHSMLATSSLSLKSRSSSAESLDFAVSSSLQDYLDLDTIHGPSTSGLQFVAAQSKQPPAKCFSSTNVPSGSSDTDDDCIVVDIVKPKVLHVPKVVDLVSSSDDERTIVDENIHSYCRSSEDKKNCSSPIRKEHQGEVVERKSPKKKLKPHRKGHVRTPKVKDYSNCENMENLVQSPISPPLHEQSISLSSSASQCETFIENVNYNVTSQELQEFASSPLRSAHESHAACSSSSTDICKALKLCNTNKKPKDCDEDATYSTSLASVTQTSSGNSCFSKKHSDFTLNHCKSSSSSLTQNETEKEKHPVRGQQDNNSSYSYVENATLEVNETKKKLRSVICKFPTSDQPNSRSDSSSHSSCHSKKHKHKKKKKKHGKHKHHKHSPSVSDWYVYK